MQPHFATSSIPVSRLFAQPFQIETPAYQRSYAWTEKEAGQLIEDLSAAMEAEIAPGARASEPPEEPDYFLGSILLVDRDAADIGKQGWPFAGATRPFEVVDGLQRVTTLSMILCVLRDIQDARGEPDSRQLRDVIYINPKKPWFSLRGSDEAFFETCVRAAVKSGRESTDEPLPAEKRIHAVQKMLHDKLVAYDADYRARLASFLLDNCFIVLITTTGIDRAHQIFMVLNGVGKPLARNEILKADCLGRTNPETAKQILALWDAMQARLGEDFEPFFAHVRAIYGRPTGPIISSIRGIVAEAGGAQNFVQNILKPAADAFDEIRHARAGRWPQGGAIAQLLRHLHWLPSNDWVPPALQFWLSAQRSGISPLEFFSALDRLAYGFKILGLSGTKRATRYAKITAALRGGANVLHPTGPLALTGQEERTIRYLLRDMHGRAPAVAKLLLLRINDRMAGAAQNLDPETLTVEHVLPRKHSANCQWRRWFEDPQERGIATESLGNLILVSKAQNDKASNLELGRKQAIYFQPGLASPVINEGLRSMREWRPADVEAREAELFRYLDAMWNFGLTKTRGEDTRRQ